jgi:adenylosuccinate lyase
MQQLWSAHGRVIMERRFWLAVLKAQQSLGIEIPAAAISAYEQVAEQVDLESIRQREARTRHDVKARIEEFCALAGYEHIHKGMTSRDLTDNVEQFQIFESLKLARDKYLALLASLAARSLEWQDTLIVGRTHYAAAQPTTVGKRLAMFGEEMLLAVGRLEELIARYPLRGLKGAVGTGLDQLTLFDGDQGRYAQLQERVLQHLGFNHSFNAVGQIYPRSLDFDVLSCLFQLGGGIANFARTWRLMAGTEAATEGFAPGQVGSSAMPHKMNTRSTERINGLQMILGGYVHMVGNLVGDQWFEGDVSCSVVRRVALPDGFFAFDGMVETAYHVIEDMGIYPAVIERDWQRFIPFLSTTTLLMEAVRRGAGREEAHEAIKEHAVAVALELREAGLERNDLALRLGQDSRFPLTQEEIETLLSQAHQLTGTATQQVQQFAAAVEALLNTYPAARTVEKSPLL